MTLTLADLAHLQEKASGITTKRVVVDGTVRTIVTNRALLQPARKPLTPAEKAARKARAVVDGTAGNKRGAALEVDLAGMHAAYAADGLAMVQRQHTKVRLLTRPDAKGHFRGCFLAKEGVDFVGVIGVRAVFIEAKATKSKRFQLRAIKPQQVSALMVAHDLGALALLVIRIGVETWAVRAEKAWTDTRKSWGAADLDALGVRLRGVDWLSAADPG